MNFELQFLVMINSDDSLEHLIAKLIEALSGNITHTGRSFLWRENWVQVDKNPDHQEVAKTDTDPIDDAFLYYTYRVEVSPLTETITIDEQLTNARQFMQCMQSIGLDAVICADFESLL